MKRPSFHAAAVENARRDPEARTLEVNLKDGKGNTQNLVLSNEAVNGILAAVFQKRMEDPTRDFFLDESIPLAGIGTFRLPGGEVGLRLYLNSYEVFDVSFAPEVQQTLKDAFRHLAEIAVAPARG